MSMKIKAEAVASIGKMAAACRRKRITTEEEGLDRFVYGYLTIFHLWEDEEALREMAGYVPPGSLQDELMEKADALRKDAV